jgi:hypothetical protein
LPAKTHRHGTKRFAPPPHMTHSAKLKKAARDAAAEHYRPRSSHDF